jgi:hypothetical protein
MVAETLLSFRSKQKGVKTFLLIVDLETVSREPHSGRVATL